MDSSGRIYMEQEIAAADMATAQRVAAVERAYRKTMLTDRAMPDEYNARKVLAALEKLDERKDEIPLTDAALLPLTPGEKGFVLGVLYSRKES